LASVAAGGVVCVCGHGEGEREEQENELDEDKRSDAQDNWDEK